MALILTIDVDLSVTGEPKVVSLSKVPSLWERLASLSEFLPKGLLQIPSKFSFHWQQWLSSVQNILPIIIIGELYDVLDALQKVPG